MTKKEKYYRLTQILLYEATYNMIQGERSNGKTFSVEEYALKDFCESGYNNQLGLIRRWVDDFTGKRGQQMFDAIVENGLVKKYSKGEWTHIKYYSSRWYLCKYDEKLDKTIMMDKPFAFGFALNSGEHDKSTSYPNIKNILFDEFATRTGYLKDEFVLFMNVLSTIIRDRDDVKIFMCANTVDKYCPYYTEMGLKNATKMKQGTIDLYTYGESGLTVAVEYCADNSKSKKSNKYFAFDNPKLKMITDGSWEIDMYPHLPYKYKSNNIKYTFFIEFSKEWLQCELIRIKTDRVITFVYIHRKTTKFKDGKNDRVYTLEYNPKPNYRRFITKPQDELDTLIYKYFKEDRVFYQDNEVGEVVRGYLENC